MFEEISWQEAASSESWIQCKREEKVTKTVSQRLKDDHDAFRLDEHVNSVMGRFEESEAQVCATEKDEERCQWRQIGHTNPKYFH